MSSTNLLILSILIGLIYSSFSIPVHHQDDQSGSVNGLNCDGSFFKFIDDPKLDHIIAQARAKFLATRPLPVTRLAATVLLPHPDGTWRRGSFNPFESAYPASCVKLTYLLSAVKWCLDNGKHIDCLDNYVRPMIINSDNFQTGIVVDMITGAPNYDNTVNTNATYFAEWVKKRFYTENYLTSLGLMANQTVRDKTYPANSGQMPWGAEGVLREKYGMNLMNPICSSTLILEIVKGKLQPQGTEYMRELLNHRRWDTDSSFGYGVPPGTVVRSKVGAAYDTLEEIGHIQLPNGKEFILSTFTNGLELSQPYPYDISNLGTFIEFVIDGLGLRGDDSPPLIRDWTGSPSFQILKGSFTKTTQNNDKYGSYYYTTSQANAAAAWNINFPSEGMYELAVWSPQSSTFSTGTVVTVNHQNGVSQTTMNQQHRGGRWVYIGDYNFRAGVNNQTVVVTKGDNSNLLTVVDAVKLTKWPYCNGSPGAVCPPKRQD